MKDAARLLVYFVAVVLIGAFLAPLLFWSAQALADHGIFTGLRQVDFESFFHRALLVAAVILLWPLFRLTRIRSRSDLQLEPDKRWLRHLLGGVSLAAIPLLCCGAVIIACHVYSLRAKPDLAGFLKVVGAGIAVPVIEETFFRGLILGVLLRSGRKHFAILATSALFAIVHFLKAPEHTSAVVTWLSGFNSIAHAFAQFADPILVAAAFTTLFVIGLILADARVRTRSLWLPVGLHSGWILAAGIFNKLARRQMLILPWLGKNLLMGVIPLFVALVTWLLIRIWLRYDRPRES